MEGDKLVAMANQIAAFFRAYPDEAAIAGIRDHIKAFWTPGMRHTLEQRLQEASGASPLVVAAMTAPVRAASPIAKGVQGPGALGHLASDAG